jgi:hypothetical protein
MDDGMDWKCCIGSPLEVTVSVSAGVVSVVSAVTIVHRAGVSSSVMFIVQCIAR